MEKKETLKTFELKTFTDEKGRILYGKYPLNEDPPSFIGLLMIPSKNMGPLRLEMEFPKGLSMEECFDKFDELSQEKYKKIIEKMKKEEEETLVVTPDNIDSEFSEIKPKG